LANKYSVSYTLGWNEEDHSVAQPEYALFVRFKNDNADGIKNFALTDYTSDYGTLQAKENEEANIASYETVTIDNVSELITAAKNNAENKITDSMIKGGFSLGLIFKAKKEKPTALYVQNFGLTSNKASEAAAMNARSFGTSKAKMADANAMINVVLAGDTSSNSYWAAASDEQFNSYDTKSYTCDIRYDMYELAYGWRNDLPPVASSVFENWMGYREEAVLDENGKEQLDEDGHIITKSVLHEDLKLIDYTSVEEIQVGELKLTELGKNSDEVYIRSIEEIKTDLDPNDASKKIYSFRCTALAYKYLGYKTMPIHIFGTERQGKDLLKFVFSGLRTSLMLGVIVALINITIGIIWGSICGYFGGLTDLMMERFTDILSGIPWIVLMTVLSIKLGQNFGVFALALCLTGWIGTASITRSQFYRYKNREYVLASRTLGAKSARLIFRHILPNAIGTIVTSSVLMVPSVIFSEATISFLGLGLQNVDSLGVILSRAEANFATYPYQLIIPSIIISLLMICFNLFGNGLRDAFNPSLKGSE
jgi:ABC-type dipeptide/oligopeptide/nickel transport system permease subunit